MPIAKKVKQEIGLVLFKILSQHEIFCNLILRHKGGTIFFVSSPLIWLLGTKTLNCIQKAG